MNPKANPTLTLKSNTPARVDEGDVFLLGNGKLGISIYGDAFDEKIVVNESSLWAKSPEKAESFNGLVGSKAVCESILKPDNPSQGRRLISEFTAPANAMSRQFSAGILRIFCPDQKGQKLKNYQRELNLQKAIYKCQFKLADSIVKREAFCSFSDRVFVCRYEIDGADIPNLLAFFETDYYSQPIAQKPDRIFLRGNYPNGPQYLAGLRVKVEDGSAHLLEDRFYTEKSTKLTFILGCRTNAHDSSFEEKLLIELDNAMAKSYEHLKEDHISAFENLFSGFTFSLDNEQNKKNSKKRVKQNTQVRLGNRLLLENDSDIWPLYFFMSRYLLLSGFSGKNWAPVWPQADNYLSLSDSLINPHSLALQTKLEKCFLGDDQRFLENLKQNGTLEARYRWKSNGFILYDQTDPYGHCSPSKGAMTTLWPLGGVSLCLQLWRCHQYHPDTDYVSRIVYPLMEDTFQLVKKLILLKGDNPTHWGPSGLPDVDILDIQPHELLDNIGNLFFLHEFLNNFLQASDLLGKGVQLSNEIKRCMASLPKAEEALVSNQEASPSQHKNDEAYKRLFDLSGFSPLESLSIHRSSSQTAKAAKRTLTEIEGNYSDLKSILIAKSAHIWARLGKAERSTAALQYLLNERTRSNLLCGEASNSLKENFLISRVLLEYILQYCSGSIRILPCLPEQWEVGEISGIRMPDDFTLQLRWKINQSIEVNIVSRSGNPCRINLPPKLETKIKEADKVIFEGKTRRSSLSFNTIPGETYNIVSRYPK